MYNIEGTLWLMKWLGNVKGKRVLEFGNQHIWVFAQYVMQTSCTVARDWYLYEQEVHEYQSIDVNGEDHAVRINLAEFVEGVHPFCNHFDVVTNVGSTEHFGREPDNQWAAFCNATLFACVGGIILHQLVPEHQWQDHCDVWYRDGIGQVLADEMNCELLEESRINLKSLNSDVDYLCVALQKQGHTHFSTIPPESFVGKLSWNR